jgi:chromosomal replication initiation ATPase DnaA
MERFELLWTMIIPKYERLTADQIKQQQELENEREIFWSALEDVVCSVVGIQSQMLYTPTRRREIVTARQIIFFLIRPCYFQSFESIGKHYGKDHATVMHGIKQATWQIECDKAYAATVERICGLMNEMGYAKPIKFFTKFVEHLEHQKELEAKRKAKLK